MRVHGTERNAPYYVCVTVIVHVGVYLPVSGRHVMRRLIL